jgi:hypothetical protein
MMIRSMYTSICCLFFLASSFLSKGQSCQPCTAKMPGNDSLTYHIFHTDTATYTLSAGQTFCIYNSGTFKGTLINNGGTICNKGRFFPKSVTFNSGQLYNHKVSRICQPLSLSNSCSVINQATSILNITGTLTLSGGTLNNEGIINTHTIQNNSGNFHNKAIVNCNLLQGSNTIQHYQVGIVNTKN